MHRLGEGLMWAGSVLIASGLGILAADGLGPITTTHGWWVAIVGAILFVVGFVLFVIKRPITAPQTNSQSMKSSPQAIQLGDVTGNITINQGETGTTQEPEANTDPRLEPIALHLASVDSWQKKALLKVTNLGSRASFRVNAEVVKTEPGGDLSGLRPFRCRWMNRNSSTVQIAPHDNELIELAIINEPYDSSMLWPRETIIRFLEPNRQEMGQRKIVVDGRSVPTDIRFLVALEILRVRPEVSPESGPVTITVIIEINGRGKTRTRLLKL